MYHGGGFLQRARLGILTNHIFDSLHEMYTGIICACLPCLRPFTKHYFPNSFIFRPNFEDRLASLRFYASLPVSLRGGRNKQSTRGLQEKSDTEVPVDSSFTSDETSRGKGDVGRIEEGRTVSSRNCNAVVPAVHRQQEG